MLAKYQICLSYCSKVIAKVKFFLLQTESRATDSKPKNRCLRIPFQRHYKNSLKLEVFGSYFLSLQWRT